MFNRLMCALLLVVAVTGLPSTPSAQQWPPPPRPAKNMDRLPAARAQTVPPEVEELMHPQTEPAPVPEAPKAPPPQPKAERKSAEKTPARHPSKRAESAHVVACSGAFAKDSSQAKLESVYKAENVTFTQVDGSDGSKVKATVLFPKDPKSRLEVWWSNEEARTDTYLIVINGKSAWTAPAGVRLRLALPALTKINHKPFKVKGLDKDGGIEVSDWDGGALSQLSGGCKIGVRLRPEAKVTEKMREAATGDKEFASADAAIRAMKPTVAEIILGY
jgi:hypothetical protein